MSKIFLIPPEVLQNLSDAPPIIKAAELANVFEAEIDHPLGLLKVNLRGILIVIRVKLQISHRINILHTTDKKFSRQFPIVSHCRKIIYNLWLECSPVLQMNIYLV